MTTSPLPTAPVATSTGTHIKQVLCAVIAAVGLAGGVEAAIIGSMMTVGLLRGRIHYGGVAQVEVLIVTALLVVGFLAYMKLATRAVLRASFLYAGFAALTGASLFAFVVLCLKYLP